jgi:geranylgeranyl diphosphate synthase type II
MPQTTTDSVLSFAEETRRLVNASLDEYTAYDDDCPENLRNAIRHSLLAPGKRLRPMLVLIAADACGCHVGEAMPAACAVEMVHNYSLIHDDLPAMDDDDLRRGLPTCHAKFGEATAILAGDALLAQSFVVLAMDVKPPKIAARCCAELATASGASALVGGQADDLAAEFHDGDLQHLERIHHRKTGALFRCSLRLGGIVARASNEQLDALDSYGQRLGLAFQIIDDLLDLNGDQTGMGKRTGKDSNHGKLTFPAVLGESESRLRAEKLIDAACASLECFGTKASRLDALARYVLVRNN